MEGREPVPVLFRLFGVSQASLDVVVTIDATTEHDVDVDVANRFVAGIGVAVEHADFLHTVNVESLSSFNAIARSTSPSSSSFALALGIGLPMRALLSALPAIVVAQSWSGDAEGSLPSLWLYRTPARDCASTGQTKPS